ncbi:MAG: hypothetical protein HYZ29_10815 [Myxococcales bacterium]|nr:hypothetical protein [Myxococcales bacterium]
MITRVGRRVLEIGVGLFALLGFAYVPLGKKTGLEHVLAIVATGPAKEAGAELLEAGLKLRARVFHGATRDAGADAPHPESLMCVEPVARAEPESDAGVAPIMVH